MTGGSTLDQKQLNQKLQLFNNKTQQWPPSTHIIYSYFGQMNETIKGFFKSKSKMRRQLQRKVPREHNWYPFERMS